MRLVNAQRSPDCGVIAIYNLLRILRLPGAKGGYQANRARLARATHYNPEDGVRTSAVKHTIVDEVYASGYTLFMRRPFWRNIPAQLMKAKAPAVAVVTWSTPTEKEPNSAHIAVVWKPYEHDAILCANAQTGHPGTLPFWISFGPTNWATASLPAVVYGSKLIEFWQVVSR